MIQSVGDPVSDISASCLRRSDDLHNLALADAEVPCDRVIALYLGELVLSGTIALEKFGFFSVRQHLVLRYKLMVSNVDEKLLLLENFKVVRGVAGKRLYKV